MVIERHKYQVGQPCPAVSPSMFSRIPIVRRHLVAVGGSKSLQAPLRYFLRVVPFDSLISLALLCVLYAIAECVFTEWYFGSAYIWKSAFTDWYASAFWTAAFPSSWRIVFLSLFVVPTFAFLQLLWLSLQHSRLARHWWRRRNGLPSRPSQEYSMLPRSESDSLEERRSSSVRDDEDCDVRDMEEDACSFRPRLPLKHQAPRYSFPLFLPLRLIFWFALLCTSLWLGLSYQQPADLRYLPLIQKANAYPKGAGYGNQGKYY